MHQKGFSSLNPTGKERREMERIGEGVHLEATAKQRSEWEESRSAR